MTLEVGQEVDLKQFNGITTGTKVEQLVLTADSDIDVSTIIFNESAATLTGGNSDNILTGDTGADTISGLGGSDTINGRAGRDTIIGGAGADILSGNGGNDTFMFAAGDTGITVVTADVIVDFATTSDSISFGGPVGTGSFAEGWNNYAGNFDLILNKANTLLDDTSGIVYAHVDDTSVAESYLFYDWDGDGNADEVVVLDNVNLAGLDAFDIIA